MRRLMVGLLINVRNKLELECRGAFHDVSAKQGARRHASLVWLALAGWGLLLTSPSLAQDSELPWGGVRSNSGRSSSAGSRNDSSTPVLGGNAPTGAATDGDIGALKAKAESGDPSAQFELGLRFSQGRGVEQNFKQALSWFRPAAESGHVSAQVALGGFYAEGRGVEYDWKQAMYWSSKAADAGEPMGMYFVGWLYMVGESGNGDAGQMMTWLKKAALAGQLEAQRLLGTLYFSGHTGVSVNLEESAKWLVMGARQDDAACLHFLGAAYARGALGAQNWKIAASLWTAAAEQGYAPSQFELGSALCREDAEDGPNYALAYVWFRLAGMQGEPKAAMYAEDLAKNFVSQELLAKADAAIKEFRPRAPRPQPDASSEPEEEMPNDNFKGQGSGFFISEKGYIVTNAHVVEGSESYEVVLRSDQRLPATLVAKDDEHDLAILRVSVSDQRCLPVLPSEGVKLGTSVATVGFPNIVVQGFSPKLAKGDIAALSGVQDDPSMFQISVPIQPGNSGGPLVDEKGNVVGVVAAILNQDIALASTGTLANNVAYAVKSSFILRLVEQVPGLRQQLVPVHTKSQQFVEMVEDVEQCAVLILVR